MEESRHRVPLDPQRLKLHHPPVADRESLLTLLIDTVLTAAKLPASIDRATIREALTPRLSDASFIGAPGFAMPYARISGLEGVRISLVTLTPEAPVDWSGEPVHTAVLVLMPHENPTVGLRILDQFQALVDDDASRAYLEQAHDAHNLAGWLERRLNEDHSPLLARDLMRTSVGRIGPETPLSTVAMRLAENNLDAAGITDADRKLLGMVTADSIFTFGMPDFFQQLQSVSFIAEFDPLHRYFTREDALTARDVMRTDVAALSPDATVLEVIFALSVKGYPKVFVVDEQRHLLGIIDRMRVLDRIINL